MSDHTTVALELDDIREVIQLLGELAHSDLTLNQKRINLLRGISRLTQTDAWVWGISGKFESGKKSTFSLSHHEGFTETQFAAYLTVLEKAKMADMFAPVLAEFASATSTLTRRRCQFDPDGLIYTDAYSEWREIGLAPLVVSLTAVPNGATSCVAIYREYDSPPYTAREAKIMHLILSELDWLHQEASAKSFSKKVYALSPRLNTVLNLLLQGSSRKEMSTYLSISPNTLSGYSKEIYKRFNVHSQVELIRKFSIGDGGDES
ncbi:helix-turn-helix transcriptional regulator [Rubritalea profundi]|uniref:HTH luxR-type domain-containing protein n=1 Tax=Rubritalea profundi TaxID=1658618 RepID=A0A2S7U2J2_9BACT|nr:LuxR C-terminal-related transcriptional regulator [Rubritalea profundi]PQJ28757.1 hypothetical protein BSZ32_09765 [Rubritalea profundi]